MHAYMYVCACMHACMKDVHLAPPTPMCACGCLFVCAHHVERRNLDHVITDEVEG